MDILPIAEVPMFGLGTENVTVLFTLPPIRFLSVWKNPALAVCPLLTLNGPVYVGVSLLACVPIPIFIIHPSYDPETVTTPHLSMLIDGAGTEMVLTMLVVPLDTFR